MATEITPEMPKSERQYRQFKANCNLYERTWRKNHKKEHAKNSSEFRESIKRGKRKAEKRIVKQVKSKGNPKPKSTLKATPSVILPDTTQ